MCKSGFLKEILAEDIFNDSYGRNRMYDALKFKKETENLDIKIPSKRTVYRIMKMLGIARKKKHKPNGITKADKKARKSDDLLKRDFKADAPFQKCITDITEIPAKDSVPLWKPWKTISCRDIIPSI